MFTSVRGCYPEWEGVAQCGRVCPVCEGVPKSRRVCPSVGGCSLVWEGVCDIDKYSTTVFLE